MDATQDSSDDPMAPVPHVVPDSIASFHDAMPELLGSGLLYDPALSLEGFPFLAPDFRLLVE